jgi:hypothetical protein
LRSNRYEFAEVTANISEVPKIVNPLFSNILKYPAGASRRPENQPASAACPAAVVPRGPGSRQRRDFPPGPG